MVAPLQGDVAWKLETLTPESPKKDGSAKAYLIETGMTPEQFMCDILAITGANKRGWCAICKQTEKATKLCRIKQNSIFNDTHICTVCINVFVEYNPTSVYNFEAKKIK